MIVNEARTSEAAEKVVGRRKRLPHMVVHGSEVVDLLSWRRRFRLRSCGLAEFFLSLCMPHRESCRCLGAFVLFRTQQTHVAAAQFPAGLRQTFRRGAEYYL